MNAPFLIRESREARSRRALHEAGRDLKSEIDTLIDLAERLAHGDLALPTGRDLDHTASIKTIRGFEARLLALREACATVADVPETEDVSDAEGFENALVERFRSHFTVSLAS